MRIVLEGLPGAGKTTLGQMLAEKHNCPLIPEFVCFSADEWIRFNLSAPFYRVNDEAKEYIGSLFNEPLVIFDRHYTGTLAFAYALTAVNKADCNSGECYETEFAWYHRCRMQRTLNPPSHVIFLDITPELSLQRQPRAKAFDPVFGSIECLKAMRDYYQQFFKLIEPSVKFHVVDGSRSLNENFDELDLYIQELLPRTGSGDPPTR